jgi:hypothetical protein
MEKMRERFSLGYPPPFPLFFPPFPLNEFEDKETRMRNLKAIREVTQKWLQAINEEIKKLESEACKANKSEHT